MYGYVGGNPTNAVDPSGLSTIILYVPDQIYSQVDEERFAKIARNHGHTGLVFSYSDDGRGRVKTGYDKCTDTLRLRARWVNGEIEGGGLGWSFGNGVMDLSAPHIFNKQSAEVNANRLNFTIAHETWVHMSSLLFPSFGRQIQDDNYDRKGWLDSGSSFDINENGPESLHPLHPYWHLSGLKPGESNVQFIPRHGQQFPPLNFTGRF